MHTNYNTLPVIASCILFWSTDLTYWKSNCV